ncbi:hypothetical protein ALC57_17619 [Trachymyrmex cornetzi]|uniref:Uncharacterized protein n=1 Tax=Trachymyrmex cornetzi TaxID=471704 RepID=A0A151ITR9_9HYME|nr:hypothetical protein ALC57_17619 [Trachymyrmex cornetzi]
MVKTVEIGLHLDGVIEILQELSLKCDDFLNITKQRVDLRVRQEGLAFKGFSASLSCRLGVRACEWELTTLPVGLDFLVSPGERQITVTCSAVFKRFSISKEFVRELCLLSAWLADEHSCIMFSLPAS